MDKNYLGTSLNKWAEAIALRISDEWSGNTVENNDDVVLLKTVLENSLKKNLKSCKKLIGTSIIEQDYFDNI